jgi:oxygen-dependent protoporphyrinogen oxidase
MNRKRRHLTIVGGGITGLTAAYYLQKGIARQSLSLDFTLLEASNRLGGKVQTDVHNGFVMEK